MRSVACVGVVMFAAAAGCATHDTIVLRDPVGPQGYRKSPPPFVGGLKVYSASHPSAYAQSEYPVHTDYTIYGPDDKVVQRIDNRAGMFGQDPAVVPLRPGPYRVKALEQAGGWVLVPVVIEEGRTTVVDLDGTAVPQDSQAQGKWVRLPDGHIVGWQGGCSTRSCR
jgi:hypothetical protein